MSQNDVPFMGSVYPYPYEKTMTLEGSPVPPYDLHTYILNARFEDVVFFLHSSIMSRMIEFYDPHMHLRTGSNEVSFEFSISMDINTLRNLLNNYFPHLTDKLVEMTSS